MSFAHRTTGCRLAALAVLTMLPMAAQAELRPAVLPAEICLVLSNGPFDADIAAIIQRRGDFADILVEAETSCPDLAGNLVGATATIPATVPNNETEGPGTPPVLLPDVGTIPVTEDPGPPPEEETDPGDGGCTDPECDGPTEPDRIPLDGELGVVFDTAIEGLITQ